MIYFSLLKQMWYFWVECIWKYLSFTDRVRFFTFWYDEYVGFFSYTLFCQCEIYIWFIIYYSLNANWYFLTVLNILIIKDHNTQSIMFRSFSFIDTNKKSMALVWSFLLNIEFQHILGAWKFAAQFPFNVL